MPQRLSVITNATYAPQTVHASGRIVLGVANQFTRPAVAGERVPGWTPVAGEAHRWAKFTPPPDHNATLREMLHRIALPGGRAIHKMAETAAVPKKFRGAVPTMSEAFKGFELHRHLDADLDESSARRICWPTSTSFSHTNSFIRARTTARIEKFGSGSSGIRERDEEGTGPTSLYAADLIAIAHLPDGTDLHVDVPKGLYLFLTESELAYLKERHPRSASWTEPPAPAGGWSDDLRLPFPAPGNRVSDGERAADLRPGHSAARAGRAGVSAGLPARGAQSAFVGVGRESGTETATSANATEGQHRRHVLPVRHQPRLPRSGQAGSTPRTASTRGCPPGTSSC